MIVNIERIPELSLYYIGSIVLQMLIEQKFFEIDDLFFKVKQKMSLELSVDYYYYALDWLYILGRVDLREGKLVYVSEKVNGV